ncbi:hypothetical protein MO867_04830 [Microbulbifer sp. OS29]|uniref:Lipoprotein n=1 Tax=Microbulbifer okhotskensis TaxID=2926617 RepID=A0A9X2EK10_9GAMM|nr:hypothetical protein [Microbulbifer okhotskensis]MCO1333662.1 hypothetical protein [Microbulbifer okhotskensis]
MQKYAIVISALSASLLLQACGSPNTRNQVVYPSSPPIPRHAEYRAYPPSHAPETPSTRAGCPGDAEELAPGSICPPSARCFDVSGGRRCISYEG